MNRLDIEVTDLGQEETFQEEIMVDKSMKRKKQTIISWVLVCIGMICIGVALYGLYDTYKEYKISEEIYEKAEEEFVHPYVPEQEENDPSTEETTEIVNTIPWYQIVSVDLKGLQSQYDEVVGWLFFENVSISYPLMQGDDNTKYLRTAFDGTYSHPGSIFVEATHSGDFSDIHTLVYGHNQRDANMFGRLRKYYNDASYYKSHPYFQIFCEDKIYRYKIFAIQGVAVDSFVFQEMPVSASSWADKLQENAMIKAGIKVDDNDRIVTLCTCTDDAKDRILVSAVLVETYDRTEQTLIQN
ncbi:MAG: class B sortase [Agathobacter sp.]|nr:class B sortase [Agathobacter sp.]MBQ3559611.1 class B sortase [Agathobacter sp.]